MVNSWIVASIIAIMAGCVGFFVVLRGSTFAAHALPLGTFPGAAAANLLGINPLWGLVVFSALGVGGLSWLARRQRNDVATGLTLITLLGLGMLFLSLSREYSQAVYGLLFGEVLGVSAREVAPVAGACALAVAVIVLCFRPLLLSAVSADLCQARGVSAARMDFLFLMVLGLATAMALPVVGALLVFSLMVGPASAARAFTRRPLPAMGVSVGIALGTIWAALALAYVSNWPVGFFVGMLAALDYAAGRCWSWGAYRLRRRAAVRRSATVLPRPGRTSI